MDEIRQTETHRCRTCGEKTPHHLFVSQDGEVIWWCDRCRVPTVCRSGKECPLCGESDGCTKKCGGLPPD